MKVLFILLVLVPLCFGTVYNNLASFTADVANTGFSDDFNGLTLGDEFFTYTSYSGGVGSVEKHSEIRPSRFYVCGDGSGNNWLQAYDEVQYDVIVFTFSSAQPTAFAINVFASDDSCNVVAGDISVTVDGVTTTLTASATSQFFGYSNSAGITTVMISGSSTGLYFANIDNIWIGDLHCGDGTLESDKGEQCDGGTGCSSACACSTDYFTQSPPSRSCDYCQAASSCSGHGTCSTSTSASASKRAVGTVGVHCSCNTGYTGSNCGSCDTGYVGFPNCVPHCGDLILETSYGEECDGSGNCDTTCKCKTGFGNCDNNDANGCENLNTDPNNCASCGHACSLPNVATYTCTGGVCGIATCSTGFDNCDGITSNGCETDLTLKTSCGSCANNCLLKGHVTDASCSGKVCTVISCDNNGGTWADCNSRGFDGCEDNLDVNINNCGTCGSVCALANANSTVCKTGQCTLYSCKANYQSCDLVDSNGCEVNLNAVHTCGTCTNDCLTKPNVVSATCGNQLCTITACSAGTGDCDSAAYNGCEINTNTSNNNCGACGFICSLPNATSKCSAGKCIVNKCSNHFCNTNGIASDGCEAAC